MDTTAQLIALRDHHAREIKRIDDALALLKQVTKINRKTERTIERVQARTAAGPRRGRKPGRPSTKRKGERFGALDVMRNVFHSAGDREITRDELMEMSGLKHAGLTGRGGAEGQANRMLGLALARLVKRKEIKQTRAGYVARALQLAQTSTNGNHASQ